jgi:amino acid transporter
VLSRATSPKAAVAIIVLLIFVLLLQVLAQLQASSRFLFALARDNALPFSASIRKTNANRVPVIAHWMAIFICMPFAFLLIGGLRTLRGVLAVTCSSLAYTGYVSRFQAHGGMRLTSRDYAGHTLPVVEEESATGRQD